MGLNQGMARLQLYRWKKRYGVAPIAQVEKSGMTKKRVMGACPTTWCAMPCDANDNRHRKYMFNYSNPIYTVMLHNSVVTNVFPTAMYASLRPSPHRFRRRGCRHYPLLSVAVPDFEVVESTVEGETAVAWEGGTEGAEGGA